MKTLILATATVLTLGMGAAFAADGPGGTATQAEWDRANGSHSPIQQQYFGYEQSAPKQAQAQAPQQSSMLLQGSGWNSNG